MTDPIGYLIASDFTGDTLETGLRPAFVMIKAGNCRFCHRAEPDFRRLNDERRDYNLFFMRPFDGRDPRERETRDILYSVVETEDFGFPTFVFFARDGQKTVHVGSMTVEHMRAFIERARAGPSSPETSSFKPYNAL